ncbi:hypothetical protein EV122DRAFT_204179, partial [Schizophyllum commune]
QAPTLIADRLGRIVIARSRIARWICEIMPEFIREAARFVEMCEKPFDLQDMRKNSRGEHWFSICGHDRNNKYPALSEFHQNNVAAIEWFFRPGSPASRISDFGSAFVKTHFPGVARRFREGISVIEREYGVKPLFGLFFNFCLNAARPGEVERVHCLPHADYKNLALAVCLVFVYGRLGLLERCWLVMWEAGLIIQIPPGVFIAYPSALFYHFNIDLAGSTVGPDLPTPANSTKLANGAPGRGSCVWFNQASMWQTAELGEHTIKQAKAKGMNTTCDNGEFLDDLIFGKVPGPEGRPQPTL